MLCNLQTPFIQFARTLKNFTSHPTTQIDFMKYFCSFLLLKPHIFTDQTLQPGDYFEKTLEEDLAKSIKIAICQTD